MAPLRTKEKFNFDLVDIVSEGMHEFIAGQHLIVRMIPLLFINRYGNIPDRIYVRDFYKALYAAHSQLLHLRDNSCSVTLFTGVPGIGKSLFRFMRDDRQGQALRPGI